MEGSDAPEAEKEWYEDHRKSLIVCWANFQWLPNSTQEQPKRGRQKSLRNDLGESRKNKFSAHDYTSWLFLFYKFTCIVFFLDSS